LDNIGHVLQNVFLTIDIPKMKQDNNLKPEWIPNLGIHIIKEITFVVGGEPIQSFSGDWLAIYYKRYMTYERYLQASRQINLEASPNPSQFINLHNLLYTYMPFWFSKDSGLGLPLLNIEYQDIFIRVIVRPIKEWLTIIETTQGSPYFGKRIAPYGTYITQLQSLVETNDNFYFALNCHAVFLMDDEFNKLRHSTVQYLIEQNEEIITHDISQSVIDVSLNSRLPIKEFWIAGYRSDIYSRCGWGQYTTLDQLETYQADLTRPYNTLYSIYTPTSFLQQYWNSYYNSGILPIFHIVSGIEMYLDEQIRIRDLTSPFLTLAQPYISKLNYNQIDYLYNYSFSVEPLQYQPSGFLNMDRISKASMRIFLAQKPPPKPLLLIPRNVVRQEPQPKKMDKSLYIPDPAEFQPYNNTTFAYLFDIKVILVQYNFLSIKAGMCDLVIRR
jgi:hypothetical protein